VELPEQEAVVADAVREVLAVPVAGAAALAVQR
jgi:hypothetical protein